MWMMPGMAKMITMMMTVNMIYAWVSVFGICFRSVHVRCWAVPCSFTIKELLLLARAGTLLVYILALHKRNIVDCEGPNELNFYTFSIEKIFIHVPWGGGVS